MKRFKGFVIKEFYHIYRDKRSLFILFGMPIVQIMLFGFAITNEVNNVNIAIYDQAKDEKSQEFIQNITASKFFKVKQIIYNQKDILRSFQKGKIKAVLVFQPNFSQTLVKENKADIQVLTDATDPNTSLTIVNYVTTMLKKLQLNLNKEMTIPYLINTHSKMLYNPELKSVYMFVPGVMTIILMLVSAMMTSISITREKELGTMEILLVSPLKPYQVVVGKVFPYVFLSVLNALAILLLGYFVFGVPIIGSYLLLSLETILFILSALSLGVLISTIANTQQTAMMISLMGLLLPVILLSGFIFPISSMPKFLQIMSNIVPATWYILILKSIMLKGVGFNYFWKETLILFVMTLFFIGLSVKKYKIRLE
ncbi:MAG TPA: ABC transporter permease [Flavobacteriia bacterium]|nr:ABC transporter permease [Flavobacteriia bacterium]